jgi:hypothetical protein
MKKTLILILISLISTNIFAQLKAGIKFSPTLALNNVINTAGTNSNESFSNNSLGIRYSTGLNLDFHFGTTVAFGTGLWFTVKRAGFKITNVGGSVDEVYNLQYLQIPLTLKMYTNNIADDLKLYFQLGPSLDIKINERLITDGDPLLKPIHNAAINDGNSAVFSYIDISIIGGAGVEWQMGDNTALFGGLSYNRGLLNTFNPYLQWGNGTYVNADITNKTSAISLDLGVKF